MDKFIIEFTALLDDYDQYPTLKKRNIIEDQIPILNTKLYCESCADDGFGWYLKKLTTLLKRTKNL